MKQTAFRLTAKDLQILDRIRREMGLVSRTEALRFWLRQWVSQKKKRKTT